MGVLRVSEMATANTNTGLRPQELTTIPIGERGDNEKKWYKETMLRTS